MDKIEELFGKGFAESLDGTREKIQVHNKLMDINNTIYNAAAPLQDPEDLDFTAELTLGCKQKDGSYSSHSICIRACDNITVGRKGVSFNLSEKFRSKFGKLMGEIYLEYLKELQKERDKLEKEFMNNS